MNKKMLLLLLFMLLSLHSYSDVSLSPIEECCSDIVFQLSEQTKILSEQTLAIQNNTLKIEEINTQLDILPKIGLANIGKTPPLPSNKIFGMPENLAIILIPALITLLVFFCGELIKWYSKQKAIQNETRSYRTTILNWIDLINEPIQKQIDSCNKLSTDIADSPDIHPERFEYQKMLADKIDSISIDRFITTFMINSTSPEKDAQNDKMTYNLVSQFDFIKSIESNLSETYKSFQIQTLALMDDWNKEFMRLSDLTSNWTIEIIDKEHPYFSFHESVIHITTNYMAKAQNGENRTLDSFNNLIIPLSQLVNDELKVNIKNEYAFEMSSILQQFRIIDKKWKSNIKGYSPVFSGIATSISNSYNSLLNAKQYFEDKTNVKDIFRIRSHKSES